MKQRSTTTPEAFAGPASITMPFKGKRLMVRPRTTTGPPPLHCGPSTRPFAQTMAFAPLSSTLRGTSKPASASTPPSMTRSHVVTSGKCVRGSTVIGAAKRILHGRVPPHCPLALVMASRNEPAPKSSQVVTSTAAIAGRFASANTTAAYLTRMRNLLAISLLLLAGCASTSTSKTEYDLVLRHATLYDGSGRPAVQGDLAIRGDRIAALGEVHGRGRQELDVHGLAVAPGFINIMRQAQESLIADGRGLSDTKQGVTTEIFGEGESMGPLSPAMKQELVEQQADIKYPAAWTTLREYLDWLQHRGVTPNVGSFLGAATPRI